MVSLGKAFNSDQQVCPEHHHLPGAVPGTLMGGKKKDFEVVQQLEILAWGGHVEKEREC